MDLEILEAIELLEKEGYEIIKEDFGMGVGGPMGLDQGIPHGGDCKGCHAQRMGLYQRSPFSVNPLYKGVPDAHHPGYWLNQIPKKKKRKKLKKRKKPVNENFVTDFLHRNDKVVDPAKQLYKDALKMLTNLVGNDIETKEKFTDAYNEVIAYERALNTPEVGKTLASNDIAHLFGRYVGRTCVRCQIDTNKDYKSVLNDLNTQLHYLAKNVAK